MHNDVYGALRRLMAYHGHDRDAVVSLYLDLTPGSAESALAFAYDACAEWLDLERDPGQQPLAERLADLLAELPFLIEDAQERGYAGLAAFVASSPELDERVALRFPFANQAVLGRDPALRQLLVYDEEYERTVCVSLATGTPARFVLTELRIGDVARSVTWTPPLGTNPLEALDARLHSLLLEDSRLHLVIAGPPDERRSARAALRDEVQQSILGWFDPPVRLDDLAFLRQVHRALQAWERLEEARGVARLLEARAAGHPVALGLDETLGALHECRVETLFVLLSWSAAGWRCDACDRLGAGTVAPACTACGASVAPVPLEEHLLDLAAASGARLETVVESAELALVGGVGAAIDASPRAARPRRAA